MSFELKIFDPTEDFYRNHVTFTSVGVIQEMVRPLQCIGLNYFTFDRTYNDGSHLRLTSAGTWIEHYYRKKLYDVAIFEKNPSKFKNGVVFWSWLNRAPVYSEAALYDIDHGLTITQPHKAYCDFYHFGTSCDTPIAESSLNSKLDQLYKFIVLFQQKTFSLIKEAELNRFILPIRTNLEYKINELALVNNLDILKQGDIKRFYLGDEFNNDYLTGKELEILVYLYNGKKQVETAKLLFVSEKTIEKHIENIKNKLKCRTMFELGALSHGLGINNIKI